MMSDLLGQERSQAEILELAESWRTLLGVQAEVKPNILWCVEAGLPALFEHFGLRVLPDAEMPLGPAVAVYSPPRIEIRESYYNAARREHPVSRFALTHELGHVVLHPQELPKFLKDGIQERQRIARMSVETQADEFAIFFLVPERIARAIGTISGIVHQCGVPYWLARRACEIYGIRYRKLQPYEIADLLAAEEEPI
jgi:hypothetical protein